MHNLPPGSIQRSASAGPARAFHKFVQENRNGWPKHFAIEFTGNSKHRIANNFTFQPPDRHPMKENILGILLLSERVDRFAGHPVRARTHQHANEFFYRAVRIALEPIGKPVQQFGV